MEPLRIEWQAPEFEYRERSPAWYWGSIAVAVLALAVAVWQRNFLFATFIVIAEIMVLVWSTRTPAMVSFLIDEHRITIHEHASHLFTDIETFSILDDGSPWATVVFHFHRHLRLPLHVNVPPDRVPAVRAALSAVIRETAWEDSFLDSLERFLGL